MKKFLRSLNDFFIKCREDLVSEYAAECAYFTFLSFIPFIIFLLSIVQYININQETVFFAIKEVIPSHMQESILMIINEIYSKSLGTISLAIIITLWSAGRGFFALTKGLRKIYKVENEKPNLIIRLEGTLYILIFIVAIILFLIIMVFGNKIHKLILNKFGQISNISLYILNIRSIFFLFAMFFIFLMIYRFIPRHKLKIKTQLPGAIFASISWHIISLVFSLYIDIFNVFSNTYGSLSSIILIMMWLYVCMYFILMGGEINMLLINKKYKDMNSKNELVKYKSKKFKWEN